MLSENSNDSKLEITLTSLFDYDDHSYLGSDETKAYSDSNTVSNFDIFTDHSYAIPVDFSETANIPGTSAEDTVDLQFPCKWETCDFAVDSAEKLEQHLSSHLLPKTHRCRWRGCAKKDHDYAQRYILTRHIRSHTGATPYSCDYCGANFGTEERCRLHVRSLHENEASLKCDFCDRMFKTTSDKSHHIDRVHKKLRLECDWCKKTFAGRTVLTRHKMKCKKKDNE